MSLPLAKRKSMLRGAGQILCSIVFMLRAHMNFLLASLACLVPGLGWGGVPCCLYE
jgi:hypothetical protein